MEKKDWRTKIGSILNNNRVDILDKDGSELLNDLEELFNQELSKAKEEGRREVLSKIKEIFETNIPHGLYSPSETSYLYERFGGAIQQYYIDELSKLKDNK